MLTPAFHLKILDNFITIFDEQGNMFVNNLNGHLDGEAFNVFPYVNAYAVDVVCGKNKFL